MKITHSKAMRGVSGIALIIALLSAIYAIVETSTPVYLVLMVTVAALAILHIAFRFIDQHIVSLQQRIQELEQSTNNLQQESTEWREISQRYQALLDSLPDLAWIKDETGKFLAINKQFELAFNTSQAAIIGKTDFDLSREQDALEYQKDDQWVMETGKTLHKEFLAPKVDGSKTWIELIKVPVISHGKIVGTVGTAKDISTRKQAEIQLDYLAHHDALTKLRNRLSLEQRLEEKIKHNHPFAVAFADLDNFKLINDSMGHRVGDEVLKVAAESFSRYVGSRGEVFRLSGDEFVIVVDQEMDELSISNWCQQLIEVIAAPTLLGEFELELSLSLGVCLFPKHGTNVVDLLKNSDIAMYQAKKSGKHGYKLFSESFSGLAMHQLSLEKRLKRALDQNEFIVRYQPMVNSDTGELVSMEALVRWKDPDSGEVGPNEFIPFAEQSGMIIELGMQVLDIVISQISQWLKAGYTTVPVSVNVSGLQFQQHHFIDDIKNKLEHYQVPGELLELEITESLLMKDEEKLFNTFCRVRRLGITLSIDDFGTGYSNLAYLSRFPINKLKIDRSFVSDVQLLPDKQIITQAIIDLAKSLELKVIAEGVETIDELIEVNDMGCSVVQGYLYSKPLLTRDIEPYLTHEKEFADVHSFN